MTHRTHPRLRSFFLVVTLLLLVLLAAACGGTLETDVTLYSSGKWEASSRLQMPASALSLAGGASMLEQSFEQTVAEEAAKGVTFSYKAEKAGKSDALAYRLDMKGDDFATLTEIGLNAEPTEYDGQEAWAISYSPTGDLSAMEQTMRVHVGKILMSETTQEDKGTLVGGSSRPINAVIIPKSPFNPWVIIFPVLAGVIIGGAVFAFVRRKQGAASQPAPTAMPAPSAMPASLAAPYVPRPQIAPAGGIACPNCGKPTLPASKFCMNCGAPVQPPSVPQA